ncbi:MAG: LamG-like jellyroll fold domain-containing protein [Verrucomicrobiota bacterium]
MAQPCVPAPSGLTGWWPAEGNANDSVGGNSGTLVNSVSFTTGEVSQAFLFDGVSSYVSIPDSPSLDSFTTSITIETWIKVNQTTANSNWKGIVTKGNSSWRLQGRAGAKTVVFSANGVSPNVDLYGSRNVNDGQWHHVAGVYDGTTMFLYVDGTLDVSQPATGSIAQNSLPLCIGQTANSTGYYFNGLIDEASIYNRALTAAEIQSIYSAGSSGKCPLLRPVSTFIPAANRVDMVPDAARGLLYITAGNQVLRYDLNAGAFLSPFTFGTSLCGIDISPDNNTLIVADTAAYNDSSVWVYVVDLRAGTNYAATFPRAFYEGGTYAVAFGYDGAAIITSTFLGSGWVPMRRYDPVLKSVTTVANPRHNSMVSASGDGRIMGVAEADISSGPLDRYDVASQTITGSTGEGWFNFEAGVNRNGSQFAVPTYGGTYIYDTNLNQIGLLGTYASEGPIGLAYDPAADLVFFAWWPSSEIRAYETHSMIEVARYDCGYNFGWVGNAAFQQGRVRVSRDGVNLFVTVGGGVRWISRPVGAPADLAITQTNSPNPVDAGNNLTYTITVTNNGPNGVTDAMVFDGLPAGVAFVSAAASQGTCILSNGLVTCTLGVIPSAGAASVNIVVMPPTGGILTNTAIVFSDESDPNLDNNSAMQLTTVRVGVLGVTPSDAMVTGGPVGGPFSPDSQTYVLTNSGDASLMWNIGKSANWLDLSATGGTLAPGASANVTVFVNGIAASLALGVYTDTLQFTNVTTGLGNTNRSVTLIVNSTLCAPVSSGLVGWWLGEGNADDVAGGNNGTLINNVNFVEGEVGQAFSFDGGSYVSIPDSPSLDTLVSSITIEAWVKFNQTNADWNWEGIINKGNSSWRLQATAGANTVTFSTTGVSPHGDLSGSRSVRDGQWHHVAGVYDGTNMYLYVDGTVDVSQAATGMISQNNNPMCIGANLSAGFFNGLIDEVSIYNRALTALEIQAIYAVGSKGKCPLPIPPSITTQPTNQTVYEGQSATFKVATRGMPPLSCQWNFDGTNIAGATNPMLMLTNVQLSQAGNYAVLVSNAYGSVLSTNAVLTVNPLPPCAPVSTSTGMVGWWPAEGNANDVTGGNNGTLVNSVSFGQGEVGQAFSFDGGSYVSIPDSPSLDNFISSITVEAWVRFNQSGADWNWEGIITKGNSSWRLQATAGANTITFSTTGLSPHGDLTGSRNVRDGQWHHVAGVYDGTNMFLYVDGMLDVSQAATGAIAQNNDPMCIGVNLSAKFFNGLIDEVSIYNRALTASEIYTIYAVGSEGKCPLAAPLIVSQPTNQKLAVGGTATFNVSARGMPPLSYQWNFSGTNMVGATNQTLTLTNLQMNQAGNYAVLVTNLYGSTLSSNALLIVYVLDHFTWNPIPSPRYVGAPFSVAIQARDLTDGLSTNFNGIAMLGTTNGVAVTPPVSGNFVQGVWTGAVMIAQTGSNLVLRADDGSGHIGLANPINVINLPTVQMICFGNNALYMWPVGCPGFVLETTGSLLPATWVAVPFSPVQIGDQYVLPLYMTGTNGFYRLRLPEP